jgi:hypothetical protein
MKKNFRIVPEHLKKRIKSFIHDDVIVACVKRLGLTDLSHFAHLGLNVTEGKLGIPLPRVPPARAGRYSSINVQGLEVIRKDLPKIPKTIMLQAPNWSGSGTHTVYQDRLVYQRDFIAPKELELVIEVLEESESGTFVLKFVVDEVLSRIAPDFEKEFLYNLNLLQENVGAVDVFPSEATLADFTKTVQLNWEILPPGSVDEIVKQMLKDKRPVTDEKRKLMEDRLRAISRFSPIAYLEPRRVCRRLFRLSHAAIAGWSSVA